MEANAYDPLEVFPLPVWECILEHLRKEGCARDLLNCSKVCTEFQRILEPTKREWLFGSICQFIFPYLKGRELLTCRRVCKNWCSGVDNFLEEFETWRPFDEGTSDISRSIEYDPLEHKKIKWTIINTESKLEKFLVGMKTQEIRTPFVVRSLDLKVENRFCGSLELLEMVSELFSLYGDHIWHLKVKNFNESYRLYRILMLRILGCMPNLKSLFLDNNKMYPFQSWSESESDWESQSESEPDLLECRDPLQDVKSRLENLLLESQPRPEISSLETLEISTASTTMLKKLISDLKLGNLKCLKLHNFSSNNVELEPHHGVRPLQHLTELHVSSIEWDDLEYICNNMISPTAPLGKISWTFPGHIFTLEIDFDRMCNIINRWKTTLRVLAIKAYLTRSCTESTISLSNLEAPNLKSLELEDIIFETQFLPHAIAASLEYLRIRFTHSCEPDGNPRRNDYEEELHNSSIWGEMKKLKVIRIRSAYSEDGGGTLNIVCTREMHKRGIPAECVRVISPYAWYDDSDYDYYYYNDFEGDNFDDFDYYNDFEGDNFDDFDYYNDFEDDNFDVAH